MNIQTNPDPRAGKPSASKFERIVRCPGSKGLENSLTPEQLAKVRPLEDDEDALRGTRIHAARETGNTLDLDTEELETYEAGISFEKQLVDKWASDFGLKPDAITEGPREERLWLNHPSTFEPLASGQLDVNFLAPPHAIIIDWKAGFARSVSPANRNWQMRLQALLLWLDRSDDITNIRVCVNRCKSQICLQDYCDYTVGDLENALGAALLHLWEADQPDAPFHAGDWCAYCPGKAYCVTAGAHSLLPGVIARRASPEAIDWQQRVQQMTIEDVFKVWNASTIINRVINACDARLKGLTKEELAAIGLELPSKGRKLDPIVKAKEAIAFLIQQGIPEDLVWQNVNLSKGWIAEWVQTNMHLREKGAKGWVDEKLDAFIEWKNAEPSLRMKK